MLGEIGTFLLTLALILAGYAAGAALWGIRTGDDRWAQSARRATYALAGLLSGALAILLAGFLSNRFELRYVALHSATFMPVYLKISALWAGQEGSLLLWGCLQALFAALAVRYPAKKARPLTPWATVFLNLITAFFVAVIRFRLNPFVLLPSAPLEGQALNPLLRHPGMIFHPPALYVGFVALAIPFAFGMAALLTRRVAGWTKALRPWMLLAWLSLGAGLLLGMRWAYDVLGWGGYWAWDPVENAGLLPWLTATALLHAAVMQDERHGFHLWNLLLATASFALTLFGTFATRSGLIESVHAFSDSNLGGAFLAAIIITLSGAALLLFIRRDALASEAPPASLLSRQGMFFLTLVLLATLTASVFIGSVLPTLTEALLGQRFAATPAWFDSVTGPQLAALLLLMGICPLIGQAAAALQRLQRGGWIAPLAGALIAPLVAALLGLRQPVSLIGFALVGLAGAATLAEFIEGVRRQRAHTPDAPLNALWQLLRQQRRKYGGYLVHSGVILMAVGIIGTRLYPFSQDISLTQGQPAQGGGYTLVYEELHREGREDSMAFRANISIYTEQTYLATLQPQLDIYHTGQRVTTPALRSALGEDLYLVLAGWNSDGSVATVKVMRNVLIAYLWLGGLVLLAGGMLAFWPRLRHPGWNAAALAGGLLLLALSAWAMWGASHGAVVNGAGRPLVGQPAPDFRLALLDGDTLALRDLRGEIVVLNFWGSWCPPCQEELPDLQQVWAAYQTQPVRFIGIAYKDTRAGIERALAEYGVTYPVGLDTGERIAGQYGITGVPETYVIAADGTLAYRHIGPLTAETLAAELDALAVHE